MVIFTRFFECVVIIRTIYTTSFLYTNSDVAFDTIIGTGLGLVVISGHDVDPHVDVESCATLFILI